MAMYVSEVWMWIIVVLFASSRLMEVMRCLGIAPTRYGTFGIWIIT